jgi:hypothetical protein
MAEFVMSSIAALYTVLMLTDRLIRWLFDNVVSTEIIADPVK